MNPLDPRSDYSAEMHVLINPGLRKLFFVRIEPCLFYVTYFFSMLWKISFFNLMILSLKTGCGWRSAKAVRAVSLRFHAALNVYLLCHALYTYMSARGEAGRPNAVLCLRS